MNLSRFAVDRPITTLMIISFVIVLGLYSVQFLPIYSPYRVPLEGLIPLRVMITKKGEKKSSLLLFIVSKIVFCWFC